MLIGAHCILSSTRPEQDRAFLREIFELPDVDLGHGWSIFALPPAEIAVHPSEKNDVHELYLMCDDIAAFVAEMRSRSVACTAVEELRWGRLVRITLPGGGKLGVYEPLHARPPAIAPSPGRGAATRRRSAKSPAVEKVAMRTTTRKKSPKSQAAKPRSPRSR
jgi:hypothetical protein